MKDKLASELLKASAQQLLKLGTTKLTAWMKETKTTIQNLDAEQVGQAIERIQHNPKVVQVIGLVRDIIADVTAAPVSTPLATEVPVSPAAVSAAPEPLVATPVVTPPFPLAYTTRTVEVNGHPYTLQILLDWNQSHWGSDEGAVISLPPGEGYAETLNELASAPDTIFLFPQRNSPLREYKAVLMNSTHNSHSGKHTIQLVSYIAPRVSAVGVTLKKPINQLNDYTASVTNFLNNDEEFASTVAAVMLPENWVLFQTEIMNEPGMGKVNSRGNLVLFNTTLEMNKGKLTAYLPTDILTVASCLWVAEFTQTNGNAETGIRDALYNALSVYPNLVYNRFK